MLCVERHGVSPVPGSARKTVARSVAPVCGGQGSTGAAAPRIRARTHQAPNACDAG
ncbi:hypothetical protein BC2230_11183 [Burkholderia cepacia]